MQQEEAKETYQNLREKLENQTKNVESGMRAQTTAKMKYITCLRRAQKQVKDLPQKISIKQNKNLFLAGPVDRPWPPVDWWSYILKNSFDVFSVFVHRNRVNLMLIFHNFAPPFQRRYPLVKTTSGSKRTSGNPRVELEYLPVFRESPSGL